MKTVRVLVVDDSAFNRRTIIKILETIPEVEVVSYAVNGEEGLRKVIDLKPDLVTLDLEMPRMDGFTFLRIIMQSCPTPVIVVSSRSDDENVFRALELGAVEFIAKPSGRISPELFSIREDLVRKVREIAQTDMKKITRRSLPVADRMPPEEKIRAATSAKAAAESRFAQVVIGASTGGPPALQSIFSAIREPVPVGFAVSQHMPSGFTRAFAERLNRFSVLEIREAEAGARVQPGQVLIAPGGKNLTFRRRGQEVVAETEDPPAGQRYIPSVDSMFTSAAEIFGTRVLGIILTGMGNDGVLGVQRIADSGGEIIAEAEETSVVFGMPKEAIATGRVNKTVPLHLMFQEILRCCEQKR